MTARSRGLVTAGALILVLQAILSYRLRRDPYLPAPPPLASFPVQLGSWNRLQDGVLEESVLEMLGPDDVLNREYELADSSVRSNLFVAYYKTQLRARNAHDPKVCLSGSGWDPRESRVIPVSFLGSAFPVNYYRVVRGTAEAVLVYWFQTNDSVIALARNLNFQRFKSTIKSNRTDMALVRIVVPVDNNGVEAASAQAIEFAKLTYQQMLPYFPPQETN